MKYYELLQIVKNAPVFTTGFLLAGDVNKAAIRSQISRWVREGKLIMLERGCYTIAPSYSGRIPSSFVIANAMKPASYVSCQSALAWYGLIPEHVPSVVSVTYGRTDTVSNKLGNFIYRHVKSSLLWGFETMNVSKGEKARIALPEKALLDLVYLEPEGDSEGYLEQLRLQNTDELDRKKLITFAHRWGKPKIERAAGRILSILEREDENTS
ncbi:MAG: hypothetical protein K8R76_02180 [Candidatus Aegiribacteria sp.]|nr:hypothetical protein [Candidatus Aegiribacteria sp.]